LIFGTGVEEFLVLLVFVDDVEHALVQPVGAIEHFSLPVEDEFLQVKRYGFGDTEVFSVLGDTDLHLFADPEEMVDGVTAGEDDGGELWDVYFLFAEILGRDGLQPDKRMECKFYFIFLG